MLRACVRTAKGALGRASSNRHAYSMQLPWAPKVDAPIVYQQCCAGSKSVKKETKSALSQAADALKQDLIDQDFRDAAAGREATNDLPKAVTFDELPTLLHSRGTTSVADGITKAVTLEDLPTLLHGRGHSARKTLSIDGTTKEMTLKKLPTLLRSRGIDYTGMTPSIEDLTKCYIRGDYFDGVAWKRASLTVASLESIGEVPSDDDTSHQDHTSAPATSAPTVADLIAVRDRQREHPNSTVVSRWPYVTPSVEDLARHYCEGETADGKANTDHPRMVTFADLPPMSHSHGMTPSMEDLTACYLRGDYCDGFACRRASATVASLESIGEGNFDSYISEQDDTSTPTESVGNAGNQQFGMVPRVLSTGCRG